MKKELDKNNPFNIVTHIDGEKIKETFYFSLAQQPRTFKVEAMTEQEARDILENCDNLTEYEDYDNEIWQPDFELLP